MVNGKILITGGAGYIGTHTLKQLLQENFSCVVLDDLSTGFLEPIELLKKRYPFEFIKGNLQEKDVLQEIFKNHQIDAVIHLAAKIEVEESFKNPELYYQTNYINSVNLIEVMLNEGIKNLIFSSTAGVYGNPKYSPIDEKHPTNPLNPYAKSKLDFENYLKKTKNLNYIILRYFNVGGSDIYGLLGKSHIRSQDLIENILEVALGQKNIFEIYGNDYDTPDGTPIRDLVHVDDIGNAHLLAMKSIDKFSGEVFNLGSEKGFSLQEIFNRATKIIKKNLAMKVSKRREGDIVISIANSKKAKEKLGWRPKESLDSIIQTDWNWRTTHPLGYTE